MTVLYRMYGIYSVLFGVMGSVIAATAFRRGERWAWWALLVGNTVALVSAMTYDRIVHAIGPFELTEYLGLALVWGALAVTAPDRAAARRFQLRADIQGEMPVEPLHLAHLIVLGNVAGRGDHGADEQGHTTIFDGIRTPLPEMVHPGQADVNITITVVAPPGRGPPSTALRSRARADHGVQRNTAVRSRRSA